MSNTQINPEDMILSGFGMFDFSQLRPNEFGLSNSDSRFNSDSGFFKAWFNSEEALDEVVSLTGMNQFNSADPTLYGMALEDIMNFAGVAC